MTRKRMLRGCALGLALLAFGPAHSMAQQSGTMESNSIRLRQEALRLQEAEIEFERAKGLLANGLVSTSDYQRKQIAVESARLSFELAKAEILGLGRRISVGSAVKVRRGVQKFVRLSLALIGGVELVDGAGAQATPAGTVATVAIKNNAVNVGRPYERSINFDAGATVRTAEFELLRDVDEIVVHWQLPGRQEDVALVLERDSRGRQITIESERFSQEADLGSEAIFDLRIEAYAATVGAYTLSTSGLPDGIRTEFVDPITKSRLTQLRLGTGAQTATVNLRVLLPREATASLHLDRPLGFHVALLPADVVKGQARKGVDQVVREVESGDMTFLGGIVRLELLPRGVPLLEFTVQPLFLEGQPGDSLVATTILRNVGTRRLEGLRAKADVPQRWRWRTDPEQVPSIEPGHEQRLRLVIDVDKAAEVGEREIRFGFDQGDSAAVKTPTEPKMLRIRLDKESSLLITGALGLLLMAVAGAAVWIAIRLGRR